MRSRDDGQDWFDVVKTEPLMSLYLAKYKFYDEGEILY